MNQEEFNNLFGKTTFIEHLNEKQQTELFETVKNLIDKEKVKEFVGKIKELHHENCFECKLRLGYIQGGTPCSEMRAILESIKELGVEDK